MNIRRADGGDIPAIMRLLLQVNDVHADGRPDLFRKGHTKYDEVQLKEILADSRLPVFIAEEGGEVLGYAFCRHDEIEEAGNQPARSELYIDDICFDEEQRGKGYAKQLYEHVREYAASKGVYRLTLHVWECNPRAKRFYEGCGMKPYFYAMEDVLRP